MRSEKLKKKDAEWHRAFRIKNKELSLERQRAYNKKYYGSEKEIVVRTRRVKERKEFIENFKKNKPCKICGYSKNWKILEFHHINPKEKEFEISRAIKGLNLEKIKMEIDKCILLCPNCHRELHLK